MVVGRVAVGQVAAHGTHVAHQGVGDDGSGVVDDGVTGPDQVRGVQVGFPGQGADVQFVALLADVAQPANAVEVHQVGGSGQLQLHHGDEALAPGQHPGIRAVVAQQGKGGVEGGGGVVLESRRYHDTLHSRVKVDALNVTRGPGKVNAWYWGPQ